MTIMYFNGNKIGDRFLQFNPKRGILPEVENTVVTVGRSNGGRFQYGRFKPRVITVDYDVSTISQREFEKRMAPLLYTSEPAKLVFSDAPNEYWMAKVDGSISLERAYYLGSGTINFIVPDGLAHAVTPKTFTQDADGTVTIKNEGTGPSYPLIHCVMHGDNGIAALANDAGGALQFGDAEEVDEVSHLRSDKVTSVDFRSKPASGIDYNTGALEYAAMADGTPNVMTGSVNWDYSDEAASPVFSGDNVKAWNGPSMHGTIKPNYAGTNVGDFQFWNRFGTYPTAKGRFRMTFILQSGDTPVVTMNIRSSVTSRDDLIMDCVVNGIPNHAITLDRKKFTKGWQECQLNRKGDQITFLFGQIKSYVAGSNGTTKDTATQNYTITVDGIGDTAIDSWTLWAARYQNSNVPTLWWANTLFRWVNETEWDDVPNLYSDGDELVIDTKQRKAFLNGVDTGWYVPGNGWDDFIVNKPQMVIQPMQSEWAEPMTVTVELEEAFV
jgi:predicted phage tail component-like protein